MSKRLLLSASLALLLSACQGTEITSPNITLPVGISHIESLKASGNDICLLYTSPSPRDATLSRMPSSA